MPKVRVLVGKCSHCELEEYFEFFDSRKVIRPNHGITKILCGEYVVMPMGVNEK